MLSNSIMEKSFEPKMLFWVLLGPVFLIFSLLITSLQGALPNGDLWVVAIIGIGLCSTFQRKGLFLSLALLLTISLLKHYRITSHHLWQLGIEASLFFGFLITYISFDFLSGWISSFDIRAHSLLQKQTLLEEELEREEEFFVRQKKGWQDLLDEKEKKLEALTDELQSLLAYKHPQVSEDPTLRDALLQKEALIVSLQKSLADFDKRPAPSIETNVHEKILSLENANKLLHAEKEKLSHSLKNSLEGKEKEIQELQEKISSLEQGMIILKKMHLSQQPPLDAEEKKMEHLYKQLKKQFNEKDALLHQARKDLFQIQEKLEATIRESKENYFKIHPKEKTFLSHVQRLEDRLERVISENCHLQELVTALNFEVEKKSLKGKKNSNKISNENDQLSLFF